MSALSRHHNARAGYNARKHVATRSQTDEAFYRAVIQDQTLRTGVVIGGLTETGTHTPTAVAESDLYAINAG